MKDSRIYARPFKRLLSFLIDLTILAFVGLLLGLIFEDFFFKIGTFGKIIGFFLAGLYFSFLENDKSIGQSIGKKILKIKVVHVSGNSLSFIRSFLRYSIWGICYYINGMNFSGLKYESLYSSIGTILLFGGGFIIPFLFVFNRKTKQSLHDLCFSTYVIDIKYKQDLEKEKINKYLIPVGIIIPLIAFTILFTANTGNNQTNVSELDNYRTIVTNLPEIKNAGVSTGQTTVKSVNGSSNTSYYMAINILLEENYPNKSEIATKVASLILREDELLKKKDFIIISVAYGYDIGIWSQNRSVKMQYPPDTWIQKISEMESERAKDV